ncbi:Uncharacterised protein [Mycobacteroides abscessus subsp. abscessus]|nr:Uncharacterised protein [Mycobacteroides abscessus subsp. abscessus]
MVVTGSTKGTCASTPANSSGARFTAAPTSSPPALPPQATSRSGDATPESTRYLAADTKSEKLCFLCSILPSSYQRRPISPPPRT